MQEITRDRIARCIEEVRNAIATSRSSIREMHAPTHIPKERISQFKDLAYDMWMPCVRLTWVEDTNCGFYISALEKLTNYLKQQFAQQSLTDQLPISWLQGYLEMIEIECVATEDSYARGCQVPSAKYLGMADATFGLGGIHKPVGGPKV